MSSRVWNGSFRAALIAACALCLGGAVGVTAALAGDHPAAHHTRKHARHTRAPLPIKLRTTTLAATDGTVSGRVVVANGTGKHLRATTGSLSLGISSVSRLTRLTTFHIPALKPHASSAKSVSGRVPVATAAGSYRAVVCLDTARRFGAFSQKHDCTATAAITVGAPAIPPTATTPTSTVPTATATIPTGTTPTTPAGTTPTSTTPTTPSPTPVPFKAVSLPGPPPISASAFHFEAAGSVPADHDALIPSPSAPAPPDCTVTLAAPANGSVSALQRRINADIADGTAFAGDTICLTGTFKAPIDVRAKFSAAQLTIASAPGHTAVFNLAGVAPTAGGEDPNEHDGGDVGAIEIGDSRNVTVQGLIVENWITASVAFAPAGIYVTDRSDSGGTVSACFTRSPDHVCGNIDILDNTVERVENNAPGCGNGNINAYGIAVKAFGQDQAHVLQHVVVEGNTITQTATGESETVTVNGDIEDFLVAGNTIDHVNNLGLDMIGRESGTTSASQARHGYVAGNDIYDVDSSTNTSGYGHTVAGVCRPGDDQAAGLYVDGGSYLWLNDNMVTNTNHGIELGSENDSDERGTYADHLLVTGNDVSDGAGTTFSGSSAVGHAYAAMMIDGGAVNPATVEDIYVHGNQFTNDSQFYNDGQYPPPTHGMSAAVIDVELSWQSVWLLGNTITAGGASDTLNAVISVDSRPVGSPTAGPGVVIDCNTYDGLSTKPDPADADNFDISATNLSWGPIAAYQAGNGMATSELGLHVANQGWDADSAAGSAPHCPFALPS